MEIEYRGYTIEVMAIGSGDIWAADVCIKPVSKGTKALAEKGEIDGAANQSDAEYAGLQWGKYRIDLFALREV